MMTLSQPRGRTSGNGPDVATTSQGRKRRRRRDLVVAMICRLLCGCDTVDQVCARKKEKLNEV